MAVIRAQVVHEHVSGLARDQSVNTLHFNGLITDANLVAIKNAIVAVFNSPLPVDDLMLGRYLANHLTSFTVKLYDVTDEPSGPPLLVSPGNGYPGRAAGADLPSEVAFCLSFQGTPEGGLVQTRRRGRVYLGPLNTGAAVMGVGPAQPLGTFTDVARRAFKRLATSVDAVAEWVVYSRPYEGRAAIERPGRSTLPAIAARPGTTVNIDQVWTDNAFDTQRRRGERPSAKIIEGTGE